MANAEGGITPAIARVEIVGAEPAGLGIVIEIPLDTQVIDGFEAQTGNDGSEVAGLGKEGDRAGIQGGVENIAPAGDEGSAEIGIEEILLRDLPTGPFTRMGSAWLRRTGGIARRQVCACGAEVETLGDGVADLIGVGGDIAGVDGKNVAGAGADAAHKMIGEFRLDDVTHYPVPVAQGEIPFEGRGTDIEGGLAVGAPQGIVANGGYPAIRALQVGDYASRVKGEAQGAFWDDTPSAADDGHGEVGVEI